MTETDQITILAFNKELYKRYHEYPTILGGTFKTISIVIYEVNHEGKTLLESLNDWFPDYEEIYLPLINPNFLEEME